MEHRMLMVRLTEDQKKILEARARSAGFLRISEYVRMILFMPISTDEKIDKIYKKVVLNEENKLLN